MFTGIIEEIGTIQLIENRDEAWRFRIQCQAVLADAALGDSIAVNGVCLTIVAFSEYSVDFDILDQTLRVTNLAELEEGHVVNLERALRMQAKLGGHLVSGHVDQTAKISKIQQEGKNVRLDVEIPAGSAHRLIDKGSVTIDGISLTIAELSDTQLTCWLIPKTLELTNLSRRSVGDQVNLEFDLVGKYIERMVRLDPSLATTYQSPST
ncbi:MAG: riboflavin synthase [Verrucomicrobiota bacterium]